VQPSQPSPRARLRAPAIRLALALLLLVAALAATARDGRAATTCSAYSNQAAAQRAADTRDADGDGNYCESLPCPCAKPGDGTTARPPAPSRQGRPGSDDPVGCTRPRSVQAIGFSGTKYPRIRAHTEAAIREGWPRTLVLNREGADGRRGRLLQGIATRSGYDRDEYPPAVGRGFGPGLDRGAHPLGWRASVAYVPSAENRSHGSVLGIKLRRFCDGTRFRYLFY
jgi:hypothetical protein